MVLKAQQRLFWEKSSTRFSICGQINVRKDYPTLAVSLRFTQSWGCRYFQGLKNSNLTPYLPLKFSPL